LLDQLDDGREASSSRQSGSVGSQSAMITFQHNIISEPLQHSYHYNDAERAATGCTNCYQEHAFAASISGEIGSYHHNLIAHSTDRNWSRWPVGLTRAAITPVRSISGTMSFTTGSTAPPTAGCSAAIT
jgi:hypothetical protein